MTDPMSYPKTNGALAEYIVVRRDWVATVPRGVSMEEASTLGPPGVTCFAYAEKAGLIEVANDGDGDGSGPRMVNKGLGKRVLITGGSTATGLFMLQLARVIVGEEGVVVTTCSPKHNDAVKALGADETIDYTTTPNLHAHLTKHYSSTPFDFIMDITGTDRHLYPKSPAYLHQNGTFAFAGAMSATHADVPAGLFGFLVFLAGFLGHLAGWGFNMVWPVVLGSVPRKCFFHSGFPNGRDMELTRQLVAEGKVRGSVDSVWRMDDGVKAFEYLATGKVRGKVVVSVRE
ncbi:zinc ion binding [Knufia obscura]|uniref:Zinc ion binding n=1 Tax=Knufia obscura TaxID=1635080 RepID=A0ABR0RRU1_9EURO|nr:zinc ion binding [Knufia obscura]